MRRTTTLKLSSSTGKGIVAAALILFSSAAAIAQKDLPLNPAVTEALYLIDIEQPTKAIAELQKIADASPTDASLLYYLGYGKIKVGDKAGALAAFDKGVALNEKEPLNFVGKGHINMLEKKPAEAKAQFDKALAMSKTKSVAVIKAVAAAYNLDNKYSVESVALLNKAKTLNPSDPDVPMLLGDTYLIQNVGGNVGATLSAYESALLCKVSDPTQKSHFDGEVDFKIGMVYEKGKNYEVAIENFEKSIKSDPGYAPSYRELGQLLYLAKQSAKAVEMYEKYLTMTEKPETTQYQYEIAFLYFMNKDFAKANAKFEKVAHMPDAKPMTLRFYSKSLNESGDLQKSRELFEKYMGQVKPEEIEAGDWLYYGRTLKELAKPLAPGAEKDSLNAKSLVSLRKSYDLDKSQGDLLLQIANQYYTLKKFPQAIAAYKELMKARKTPSAQDYYTIGQAYYKNDQLNAADSAYDTFITMKPELINGYEWKANIAARREELKQIKEGDAKPYFEKLLEEASKDPVKNKSQMIQANQYLGYYYYSKGDALKARPYYQKWVDLDPNNKAAKDALDTLDKAIRAAQNPRPAKAPKK